MTATVRLAQQLLTGNQGLDPGGGSPCDPYAVVELPTPLDPPLHCPSFERTGFHAEPLQTGSHACDLFRAHHKVRAIRIAAPIESAPPRPSEQGGGRFLPRLGFKALAALAEVVVDAERLPPEKVAANVDGYMGSFRAQRTWVVKVALVGLQLYPLRFLKPPLSMMKRDARRDFVEKRFIRDIAYGRIHLARHLIQAMFRLSTQMAYLGYYSDEKTFDSVGYQPFEKRSRFPKELKKVPEDHRRVKTVAPGEIVGDTITADVVVVGSGAGGAIVAYRLAELGRSVLVLERGLHLHPSQFSEDEVKQISSLYADGALQLTRDFSFQVLQGMCVGGSTVVNNAVCFNLPDDVRDDWNRRGAGLDPSRLATSFAKARDLVDVQRPPSKYLQRGADKFVEGADALGLTKPRHEVDVVEANIADCPGSGYCNIGCPYGTKLSMLDKVLPDGQEQFGAENLRVLPECRAEKVETKNGRAAAVLARLGDGRKLRVEARTVVVSAGAIASSWLLMQSKVAKRAGHGVCFNMGSPITAEFDDRLDSFDGVQISHYLRPPAGSGYVMETWFNPVVSQALNMPGWLDDHRHNMSRFPYLTAAGVLVGTTEPGRLRPALTGGVDIDYTPAEKDVKTLIEALKLLSRIYLRAGAKRVMPSTFQFHAFTDEGEVDKLDFYLKNRRYLSIGSGHPQGGNALSGDDRTGVVDPSFRVHGFENLFVCDASVFPTATTVNPQLTVMALAEYAAPEIEKAR
jgi:choline dehydrogenase-like flavoprotein